MVSLILISLIVICSSSIFKIIMVRASVVFLESKADEPSVTETLISNVSLASFSKSISLARISLFSAMVKKFEFSDLSYSGIHEPTGHFFLFVLFRESLV